VVNTAELTTNEIFDLKHEFDEFLKEEYQKAGDTPLKKDVLQSLFQDGKRIFINPTWEKIYLSKRHIVTFLEHLSDNEQNFNKTYYIVRSFEDIKLVGDILVSEVGTFKGLEKDVLMYATGIYNALEMAEKFNVSIREIEETYYHLNERCLVYMSEF
jgi:hypothetical protein